MKYAEDYKNDLSADWRAVRKRLDSLSGLASLIVPEALEILKKLHNDLTSKNMDNWIDQIAHYEKILGFARWSDRDRSQVR